MLLKYTVFCLLGRYGYHTTLITYISSFFINVVWLCFNLVFKKFNNQRGVVNGLAVLVAQRSEMMSYSNFELNSTKKPRDEVKGVFFKFSIIC